MATEIRPATAADWPAIEQLLIAAGLPLAGAKEHLDTFIVAQSHLGLRGCAALERYGDYALLRSVAVDSAERGAGLGERLVREIVERAESIGLDSLFLLTTSAADWFPRFGFRTVSRRDLPPSLGASHELRGACPDTAVIMTLSLSRARSA